MNENLKNLLEKVSADEALRAKFEPITKMEDKDGAVEAILALAAEAGMPLTATDLEPDEQLDLDELDSVAGGGACACVAGGGGTAGSWDKTCACVVAGWGEAWDDAKHVWSSHRCGCSLVGGGTSKD